MIPTVAVSLGLFVWGAHALLPWELADAEERFRRAWSLAALPLLLAGVTAGLLRLRSEPDAAVAQGLGQALGSSSLATAVTLAVLALWATDTILAVSRSRCDERFWTLSGTLGLATLLLLALAGEKLRAGEGPSSSGPLWIAAAGIRVAVALAAAETFRVGRPRIAVVAGPLLALYPGLLPPELADLAARRGLHVSAWAAAALFLVARWLPHRWRRPILLVAALFAGVLLARFGALSGELAGLTSQSEPPVFLP